MVLNFFYLNYITLTLIKNVFSQVLLNFNIINIIKTCFIILWSKNNHNIY